MSNGLPLIELLESIFPTTGRVRSRHTIVIAEAGVNHHGSLDIAIQLVDAAAAAGADGVKFQTFTAEKLVTAAAPKADYQTVTTGYGESQLEMLQRLELSRDAHCELAAYSR